MAEVIVIVAVFVVLTYFHKECVAFLALLLQEKDEGRYSGEETMTKRLYRALPFCYCLILYPLCGHDNRMLLVIGASFLYLLKKDYWKKRRQYRKELAQLRIQFPIWLRQIQILLQTNTVLSALQLSYTASPELMKKDLKALIAALQKDAISLEPYLRFLSRYQLAEVERAMKLLYRYQCVGETDCDRQLNGMIQTTTRWLRKQRQKRSEEETAIYQWWGMLPLFGVTVVFMAVMFEMILQLFGKGVMG